MFNTKQINIAVHPPSCIRLLLLSLGVFRGTFRELSFILVNLASALLHPPAAFKLGGVPRNVPGTFFYTGESSIRPPASALLLLSLGVFRGTFRELSFILVNLASALLHPHCCLLVGIRVSVTSIQIIT